MFAKWTCVLILLCVLATFSHVVLRLNSSLTDSADSLVRMASNFRLGSIDEYDSSEMFTSYLERLEQYFLANDIGDCAEDAAAAVIAVADKKKVAVLISVIGKKVYGTLRDLCSPTNPKEKTFKQLCDLLSDHYRPKRIEVAESFRFHHCVQEDNESVSSFSAKLRRLASTCNFGTHLVRALRDQFVSGVRNAGTRKKLLQKDRTFEESLQVAIADEAACREIRQIQTGTNSTHPVHNVQAKSHPSHAKSSRPTHTKTSTNKGQVHPAETSSYKCFSCGNSGHVRNDCKFRDATCHKCKKKGHISPACKAKDKVFLLTDHDDVPSDEDLEEMYAISDDKKRKKELCIPIIIESKETKMQLDTGCSLSLAPKSFYDLYLSHCPLQSTSVVLSTYTGEKVHPLGEAMVKVEYKGVKYSLPLLITADGSCALFGRNWLFEIPLDWTESVRYIHPMDNSIAVHSNIQFTNVDQVVNHFSGLFEDRVGCFTGPPVKLEVTKEPSFHKARPVPYALMPKVKTALEKMQKNDIIERVSITSCAAPIVPVEKKDSDEVRICGDFKVTYNQCADLVQYPIPKIEDLHTALRGSTVFSVLDMSQAYHQIPIAKESRKYLTINTHIGLFEFKRLPNGIHSAFVWTFIRHYNRSSTTAVIICSRQTGACTYSCQVTALGTDSLFLQVQSGVSPFCSACKRRWNVALAAS